MNIWYALQKTLKGGIAIAKKGPDFPTRQKLIETAISAFLEKGFALTSYHMISTAAGVGISSLSNYFPSKEDLLLLLVERMAGYQLENISELFSGKPSLFAYCAEIAVELTLCEQDDKARELYVAAYSLPKTLDFIKQFSYKKSMALLGDRFPDWTEQDFYEIEIATAAIVFGFLMERCNARFSVKQKINRTLDNLLKLYDVGAEEREEVIAQVLDLDLNDCAEKIMAWVLEKERVKSADYLQNGG